MARKEGVIWSYIMIFVELVSSMLFTPFLIRNFGQAEYGIYGLVSTVASYLVLLDMGVGNALVRYISKYRALEDKDRQRNVVAVTMIFYGLVSVIVFAASIVLREKFGAIFGTGLNSEEIKRATIMLTIITMKMTITFVTVPFDKAMYAYEEFALVKKLGIAQTIIREGISVLVIILGGRGIAVVAVNTAVSFVQRMVVVIYVVKKHGLSPLFKGMDFGFMKEIFVYSAFIFVQMIATQLNTMADQVLIGMLVKSSAVILGVYAVGTLINQYFHTFAGTINGVLMSGVVAMVERKAEPSRLLAEMVRIGRLLLAFLGIIWGVFLVMGDEFITLWAGPENEEAYYVAVLLITPAMLALIQAIGTQILWAKNKHKVQACLKMGVALLNIVLTIFLIKWDPLIGAALGTAIAVILGDVVVMNIVFRRDIEISMTKYYVGLCKGILPAILVTIALGALLSNFVTFTGWIGFLLGCGIMVLCYGLLMWYKGFNEYEKNMIIQLLRKFKIHR